MNDIKISFSGAVKLVKHLYENKVPIAVATSSGESSVRLKTFHHRDLFDLFDLVVMASSDPEIELGKPAPDVFLTCARRFPDKPDPEKVRHDYRVLIFFKC